ncbi:uncharacterized protein LOC120810705 isoform X2 [Gasterosteus aculeatus]
MNLFKNQTLHPHLRDEEALVVENAIRLAIDSIINVLYGVNSSRTREYQRMVADKDKEIRRLESSLSEMECEVKVLRRRGFTCGLLGGERSPVGSRTPDDPQTIEGSGFELSCIDTEMTAEQQDYEMSINCHFANPPSQVSPQSQLSAPPSSRARTDRSCISLSSNSSDVSEAAGNLPMSPSSFVIKEEPCDIAPVLIKLEMSEESFGELHESAGHPYQDHQSPSVNEHLEKEMERRTLNEDRHADPGGYYDPHDEHLRNKKKGVPMSELTEEAQRQKRAAWRAASRRYYARKVARQQAHPSRSGPAPSRPGPFLAPSGPAPSHLGPFFPRSGPVSHVTDSRYPHPISFADKRRRTLISDLPEASQSLQREAWRAASKRYYARKNARHHAEPVHYAHLLQDTEAPRDPPEPNRAGPHGNSGGIMCS